MCLELPGSSGMRIYSDGMYEITDAEGSIYIMRGHSSQKLDRVANIHSVRI